MKPSLLLQALKIHVELREPAMLWGPPGVGKSDLIRGLVEALNKSAKKAADKWGLVDIRLANCDPTELKGFPMPDQASKTMQFFPMGSLPKAGSKTKGIVFLDEVNAAPQSVQAGAYQLTLDRKIGDYELPEGWVVVAAGNRSTDRSVVHAMPAALANRFFHYDFDVDFEEWNDWAIANGISDATRSYIRSQPNDLCLDKIEPGARAFNTPRTWAKADKIVQRDLSPELRLGMLKAVLGEGMATKFVGHLNNRKNMPNLDKILLDPDNVPVPESPSVRYAVLAGLEARVNANNFGRILKYVTRMGKDFSAVFVSGADRRDPEICETAEFTAWIRENRDILM